MSYILPMDPDEWVYEVHAGGSGATAWGRAGYRRRTPEEVAQIKADRAEAQFIERRAAKEALADAAVQSIVLASL